MLCKVQTPVWEHNLGGSSRWDQVECVFHRHLVSLWYGPILVPWHFLPKSLSFVSIVAKKKRQKIGITCNTKNEESNLRFKMLVWMKKTGMGLKAWGKLIQARLFLQHDPPKLCLCLPKLQWKAHSWFGQSHPRPAYYCADKKMFIKESTNKSGTDTYVREGGCTYFSIFFPFLTFRSDNIATIDWDEAIFTCRFRESSLC